LIKEKKGLTFPPCVIPILFAPLFSDEFVFEIFETPPEITNGSFPAVDE